MYRNKTKQKTIQEEDFQLEDDLIFEEKENNSKNKKYEDYTYDDFETKVSQDAELTRILIETETYINHLKLSLENKYIKKIKVIKNEREEYKNEPTQIQGTEPLMNSKGISQSVGRVRSLISHVISQSNINDMDYRMAINTYILSITKSLIIHRKEWGIKEEYIGDVRRLLTDGVILFLTRPKNDKERGYNYGRIGIVDQNKQDESVSILDKLNNWRDKRKNGM